MAIDVALTLQLLSTIGALLSGLAAIFVAISLLFLLKQARANERAATATVYQAITSMGLSVTDTFLEYPDLWRALFPADAELSDALATRKQADPVQLKLAALKYLDYIDYALENLGAVPEPLRPVWETFARDILTSSPYIRDTAVAHRGWYGGRVNAILNA